MLGWLRSDMGTPTTGQNLPATPGPEIITLDTDETASQAPARKSEGVSTEKYRTEEESTAFPALLHRSESKRRTVLAFAPVRQKDWVQLQEGQPYSGKQGSADSLAQPNTGYQRHAGAVKLPGPAHPGSGGRGHSQGKAGPADGPSD